jgi:hypothetical protein
MRPAVEGRIDPRADAALHRMSDYLAGLRTFRFETTSVDELITKEGQKIQQLKQSTVAVRRPNALAIERTGPNGRATFKYDGKTFTLFGAQKNQYASTPAPANLDEAIDFARDRLGIDAPGGDLIVADPYNALIDGLKTGRYVGLEPIDGVMAHHLAITKDKVDWQIWIQDGAQPVPLRYVITSKDMPSHPQFTLELRHWQPDLSLPDSTFAFSPPSGAQKIDWSAIPRKGQPTSEPTQRK